jgi:glycosyltransferase involved in cell wall biosynthesis
MSTLHSDLKVNYISTYNILIGSYFAWRHLKDVQNLEKVIACSNSVFQLYKDKIKSLGCITNGIDSQLFHPISKEAIHQKRTALGLQTDKIIFLSVGSLNKRKDPYTVITGFLKSSHTDTSILLILGSGNLENELRQTYKDKKNVIFKGFTEDVAGYMQVSDFFISASISEGLPNTVLEALGCGLPVCLSSIPSHKEILSINENAGYTFTCGDELRLAEVINTIMSQKYNNLQKAAMQIIEGKLNAGMMSSKYQTLYLEYSNQTNSLENYESN